MITKYKNATITQIRDGRYVAHYGHWYIGHMGFKQVPAYFDDVTLLKACIDCQVGENYTLCDRGDEGLVGHIWSKGGEGLIRRRRVDPNEGLPDGYKFVRIGIPRQGEVYYDSVAHTHYAPR